MRKEHIVHFKIIRKDETKLLRGLIYLEEGQQPTLQDFRQVLIDCGHEDIHIEDEQKFIFKATQSGEDYLIDVLEDYEKSGRDVHLEGLAKTFIKKDAPI